MNILSGMKYFKFDDTGNVEIIRIVSGLDPKRIRAIKESEKKKVFLTEEKLKEYTRLNPDGIIGFSIVKVHELEDIIITLMRKQELENKDTIPYIICRQNVTDFFTNAISPEMKYCGISISKDSVPEGVEFHRILSCDSIENTKSIAVYMDDTLDTILSFIHTKNYDNILYSLFIDHIKYIDKENPDKLKEDRQKRYVDGDCKSLKDLMELNNFMYDFYSGFGIIPTHMDLSYIKDSCVVLNMEDQCCLSEILAKNIISTIVLKYAKDIDLSKINKEYVLISDKNNNLYIVTYLANGNYHIPIEKVESEENIEKLASIVKSKNSSIAEAYNMIRYNKEKYI